MPSSPTARTLAALRAEGWTCAVVERRIPGTRVTQDLFGWCDILAIRQGEPILGIQTTDGSHHANRREKLIAEPRLILWLSTGARAEIWSWSKQGPRGKRKLWTCRREDIRRAYGLAEAALP